MIKIAVNGACGRMGARIVALVCEYPELTLVAALEREGHPSLGKDAGIIAGCGEIDLKVSAALHAEADVLIEFSSPESAIEIAEVCAKEKPPLLLAQRG